MEYKFSKPMTLKFDVVNRDTGDVDIPAGTPDVQIGFEQSSHMYRDAKTGKAKFQNVYLWKGNIYNA